MEPYLVLGVSKDDSIEKIRKKYRKLCLLYHPDKLPAGVSTKDKQERTMMFQNVNLCFERIMKERGGGGVGFRGNENVDDTYDNGTPDLSKEDIQDIIDFFLNSVYSKISAFTEHPLYRLIVSLGMKGVLTLFRKEKVANISVIDIDVELRDLVGTCTIEFDYRSLQTDNDGCTFERVNHIKTQGIYPFVLCKNMGDFGNDLVVNLKLGSDPTFDHQSKILYIADLDEDLIHQTIKTHFGEYVLECKN